MSNDRDAPSAFPWPPVLLAGVVAGAIALDKWLITLPLPFAEVSGVRALGIGLLVAAAALIVWAAIQFKSHDTTIRPDQASRALIEAGPFSWTRNPIYLSEIIALFGSALVFNTLWLAIGAPVFGALVTALAIRPEEKFLQRKFGVPYEHYCRRVRRWL